MINDMKKKSDFIVELLSVKELSNQNRERILKLSMKEFEKNSNEIEKIKDKIEEIRKDISFVKKTVKPTPTANEMLSELTRPAVIHESENDEKLPKYLNPFHLYNFLFNYNQNPILRTTCHDIDEDEIDTILKFCSIDQYDFLEHLSAILSAFTRHEQKYYAPRQVKSLIREYLTGKDFKGNQVSNGWSEKRIKINWCSSELLQWSKENPGVPPNASISFFREKGISNYKIEPQIITIITQRPVQNFTQLVLHFKNHFHIKSGSESLYQILLRINDAKNWDDIIAFEFDEIYFVKNLELFTDVEKLIQAYNKLVKLILEQHQLDEKPKVKLKFYQQNNTVYFSITHINSVYGKTVENILERKFGKTYNSLINEQINGMCNLILKADFGSNHFAMLNIWNGSECKPIQLDSFQGVEHILEFPKSI